MSTSPNSAGSTRSRSPTTAPSSPPDAKMDSSTDSGVFFGDEELKEFEKEEKQAKIHNRRLELIQQNKAKPKRKGAPKETSVEKARELDNLLKQSAAFSNILTKKTEVLGRVGSGFDGKALGEHDLTLAKQPKIMTGGTMRDYQLEGLTWMYEICAQGMSGILADEMGLGKTIQTISLIAHLREAEGYLGPHLIVAPLSTLSNWIAEFQKWTPSVPVILYHGSPDARAELREKRLTKNMVNGRPTPRFPVVVTSYELILRDRIHLSKINWEFIIIDEGHRLKNFDSKLFQELRTFKSATRLLISGTPLQNNLKELWSLLYFLMPGVFSNWEAFESWFDFSDLQDEEGTQEFIADQKKQDLIKKIHLILQPLLLRRIKADVEDLLPKKREYVLYAPMTQHQIELYNMLSDKTADVRKYLEGKVVEQMQATAESNEASAKTSKKTTPKKLVSTKKTPAKKIPARKSKASVKEESESEEEAPLRLALRGRTRKSEASSGTSTPKNAFEHLMGKKGSSAKAGTKRTASTTSSTPSKSARSSRQSTPGSTRSRRGRKSYKEADASEEDELTDEEFEQKLADELAEQELDDGTEDEAEVELTKTLEAAKKEIATKKLGNPLMQLRLVCNSPHNFYNPWSSDAALTVDESIVNTSGKMLLLDRLLTNLFKRNHKVLIFSQFKTQLDILQDYASELRKWNVCRIDGAVAQDDRRAQIELFNTDPEYQLFLLSTRAGGQGINLASADTVILFDSDWNPQQDLQAIDRAHRIGQTRPVVVFRLATKGTVEEELLLSADAKRRLEKLVIKKGGFKTMGQKLDNKEEMSEADLRTLLLKDGEVFNYTGEEEILSDKDLETLCDRSDEAYARAEKGLGNAAGFKIVETRSTGLMSDVGK